MNASAADNAPPVFTERPSENPFYGFQTASCRCKHCGCRPKPQPRAWLAPHPTYGSPSAVCRSGIYARLNNTGQFKNVGHKCPTYLESGVFRWPLPPVQGVSPRGGARVLCRTTNPRFPKSPRPRAWLAPHTLPQQRNRTFQTASAAGVGCAAPAAHAVCVVRRPSEKRGRAFTGCPVCFGIAWLGARRGRPRLRV